MRIKKKTFVLLISYLAAAAAALGEYGLLQSDVQEDYRSASAYGYGHAFEELVLACDDLDGALKKASYATGASMCETLCGKIYSDCMTAQMALAVLPFSTQELEQTAGFTGITGDYALSLMSTSAETGFSKTERDNFAALAEISDSLSDSLTELRSKVNNGEAVMDDPLNVYAENSESELLSKLMLEYEEDFPQLPQLCYDGKYSGEEAREPGTATKDEALAAAAEFLGVDKDSLSFQYEGSDKSRCFYCEASESYVILDSFARVRSVSCSRTVTGEPDVRRAEEAADEFLREHGYDGMVLRDAEAAGGVTVLSYAYCDGSAVYACDAIEISVAADTEKVCAFNCEEYLDNHGDRQISEAGVSESAALSALPQELTVSECEKLVIKTEGGRFILCYAFDCTGRSGETLRVLVNGETGKEYDIEL